MSFQLPTSSSPCVLGAPGPVGPWHGVLLHHYLQAEGYTSFHHCRELGGWGCEAACEGAGLPAGLVCSGSTNSGSTNHGVRSPCSFLLSATLASCSSCFTCQYEACNEYFFQREIFTTTRCSNHVTSLWGSVSTDVRGAPIAVWLDFKR